MTGILVGSRTGRVLKPAKSVASGPHGFKSRPRRHFTSSYLTIIKVFCLFIIEKGQPNVIQRSG